MIGRQHRHQRTPGRETVCRENTGGYTAARAVEREGQPSGGAEVRMGRSGAAVPSIAPRHRLGVATRIVGAPLRPHDSRRWQQQPHLSVSLAFLRDILDYLARQQIHFYRLSSTLAPYATHPGLPGFQHQIDDCTTELAAMGDLARMYGMRLTMHPGPWVRLESENEALAARSLAELTHASRLMEALGLDAEGVLVVHAGAAGRSGAGGATDPGTPSPTQVAMLGRFARRVDALDGATRRRLVLENDDRAVDLAGCLWLHRRTGLPVVLDLLHHRCHNPAGIPMDEALRLALATWPAGMRPKVHLSSPRTELRLLRRAGRTIVAAPLPNQHSDFLNPFDAISLLEMAQGQRPFDILLEAKAHDLALLRLREQLQHFAPALAATVA